MKKALVKISIFVFSFSLLSFFVPSEVSASAITETNVFNLTNSERAKFGQKALSWNHKLATAARNKAQDMINRDYFSHNTPDGKSPWTFVLAAGYNYVYAGENLAMNFTTSEAMMSAWMNSGGHRANILSANFKELGVGVVVGEYQGYTTTMVVQMFGAQATQVYTNPGTSKAPVRAPTGQSAPAPAPKIDYTQTIRISSDLIKKRIDDFKEAIKGLDGLVLNPS